MNAETTLEVLAKFYAEKKLAYEQAGLQNIAGLTSPELLENRILYDRLRDDYLHAEKKYQDALKANRDGVTDLPVQAGQLENCRYYNVGKHIFCDEGGIERSRVAEFYLESRAEEFVSALRENARLRAALTPPVSAPIAVAPEVEAWIDPVSGQCWPARKGVAQIDGTIPLGRIAAAPQSSAVPVAAGQAQKGLQNLLSSLDDMIEDPMWPNHAEISKDTLRMIRAALQSMPVSKVAESEDSALVQLAELMRGLEMPPSAAFFPSSALFEVGKAIAAQAKLANPALSQPPAVEAPSTKQVLMGILDEAIEASEVLWTESEARHPNDVGRVHYHEIGRLQTKFLELLAALPAPLPKAEAAKLTDADMAQPDDHLMLNEWELSAYHKLRATLERSKSVGLYDILVGADVRIRRLMHEAALAPSAAQPAAREFEQPAYNEYTSEVFQELMTLSVSFHSRQYFGAAAELKNMAMRGTAAQPAQGTEAVPDDVAKKAARYDHLKTYREVLLLTGFFGNGCLNRTIADVEAIIDARIAAAPKPPAVREEIVYTTHGITHCMNCIPCGNGNYKNCRRDFKLKPAVRDGGAK